MKCTQKGNYDLRKLHDKMLAGQIQTPFRQFSSNESFLYRDGEFISTGLSLYFGSRKVIQSISISMKR